MYGDIRIFLIEPSCVALHGFICFVM